MTTLMHRWQGAIERRGDPDSRPRLLTAEPGERERPEARRRQLGYLIAVGLPIAVAVMLIPLREDHAGTAAVVMVVPVVIAASIGATGPAIVAALVAGLAYDVFLTEPYQHIAIDDADDIAAAVTLVVVGLVVGVLASRNVHLAARSVRRRAELRHLISFSRSSAAGVPIDELEAEACRHIADLLNTTDCRWVPAPPRVDVPVLLADGNVMGPVSLLRTDRAKLPREVVLPARAGSTDVGHFVIVSSDDQVASFEERMTAATIASLFAAAAVRPARVSTN